MKLKEVLRTEVRNVNALYGVYIWTEIRRHHRTVTFCVVIEIILVNMTNFERYDRYLVNAFK